MRDIITVFSNTVYRYYYVFIVVFDTRVPFSYIKKCNVLSVAGISAVTLALLAPHYYSISAWTNILLCVYIINNYSYIFKKFPKKLHHKSYLELCYWYSFRP
jgi:glycosylphosphatidylinositol transamidase (GPIT) subunit GPI8